VSKTLVSVAIPTGVDSAFTYRVPDDWSHMPAPGSRVLAPFGPRVMVGVVRPEVPTLGPEAGKLRALLDVLDDNRPSLTPDLVKLCEWISEYYVAPVGEVYRAALPGLATNHDARGVAITPRGRAAVEVGDGLLSADAAELDTYDRRLLEALLPAGPRGLPASKLSTLRPRIPGALRRVHDLCTRQLASTHWLDDDTKSGTRTETHLRRTDLLRGSSADEAQLAAVIGRSKQRRGLLDLLESQRDAEREADGGWVPIDEVRGPFARVRELLPKLVEAGLVTLEERPRRPDPFDVTSEESATPRPPTEDQAEALAALLADADAGEFRSALLHGITGSGKTEVYLQLIAHVRAQGRGAIVLVPEIALTPQLSDRFRGRFGDEVAVLHSGLSPRQRLDAWYQIRDGDLPIVIGARSAIFAPVPRLGVIVVDEEHDPSFKQEEGVRYNARDVALVRARELSALTVLGTATPSLETYALARKGRHRWLRLRTRPTPRPLPQVEVLPLSVHRADPESKLTGRLREAIAQTVEAGDQAIIFLNRRGYTTSLVCTACGDMQACPDCSAPSMTYHLQRNRLMCHLCGHIQAAPSQCGKCGEATLQHAGVGTEKVEIALGQALPGVRVLRLDRDATRGRQLVRTLASFRAHEADVLVGTQMLSKGHDFPGVTLVGILQGDHGLAMPDPRAAERTFQLLTQVSGRAGRGERAGRVIVQAWRVDHPAIVFAAEHDFTGFAEQELQARKQLGNPPFGHLALVRITGADGGAVQARAQALGRWLRGAVETVGRGHAAGEGDAELGAPVVQLLGPIPSPIERINRKTRWQLLLRGRDRGALRWVLGQLRSRLGPAGHGTAQTLALVDVDPQSLL
jgi:primosomal protein N' (replication factor Y)